MKKYTKEDAIKDTLLEIKRMERLIPKTKDPLILNVIASKIRTARKIITLIEKIDTL